MECLKADKNPHFLLGASIFWGAKSYDTQGELHGNLAEERPALTVSERVSRDHFRMSAAPVRAPAAALGIAASPGSPVQQVFPASPTTNRVTDSPVLG